MGKPQHGFTLIELMVTVVIVSILAAIAVPAYDNYVLRGKLTEAFTNLANLRVQLEQFYQDNRNYGSSATACGVDINGNVIVPMPGTPGGPTVKYFTYTCNWTAASPPNASAGGNSQYFTVTATGVATGNTNGFAFTIDQSNNKATTLAPAGWQTSTTCWVTKPGGAC